MAQSSLNFPTERSVFQRDLNNKGFIAISGSIDRKCDSITAVLTDLINEVPQKHFVLSNDSDKGFFQDRISTEGGWYQLKISFWNEGKLFSQNSVEKVGVGEVFVICGQSNAQGVRTYGAVGAKDDRVNTVNYFNEDSKLTPPDELKIVQLGDNVDVGPNGKTPWCWGELGDQITAKYGVPVMFFNAAWAGTMSVNWFQSPQNIPTFDAIFRKNFPVGFPYKNLEISLKYYGSLFGVRSVLWHQGEAESSPGIPNYDEHIAYIKFLIESSRKDFGANVPWMISQVSFNDKGVTPFIRDAQKVLIDDPDLNTFQGPFTDTLMIPRYDQVHFGNTNEVKGLTILANAWMAQIDEGFLANAKPILSNPFVQLKSTCKPNEIELSQNTDQSIYQWNDSKNASTRSSKDGIVSAVVLDNIKNYKISNQIDFTGVKLTGTLGFTNTKSTFCERDSILLLADDDWYAYSWNNGKIGKGIFVNNTAELSYIAFNTFECIVGESAKFKTEKLEAPEGYLNPELSFLKGTLNSISGEIEQCQGDTVVISSAKDWHSYFWNDEKGDKTKIVTSNSNLQLQATYADGQCYTGKSKSVIIRFKDFALKPLIVQPSIFTLNIENVEEYSNGADFKWYFGDQLLGNNGTGITVKQPGTYKVQALVKDENLSCFSPFSEPFNFAVPNGGETTFLYPSPTQDFIRLESSESLSFKTVIIYDTRGQVVLESALKEVDTSFVNIDVNHLNSGVYYLSIQGLDSFSTKRFVKN